MESPEKKSGLDNFGHRLQQTLFGSKEQQAFFEDLSILIDDGVPPNKALEVLSQISKGNARALIKDMMWAVSQGRSLADGMVGWFPEHIVELIRAGEEGGTIAETMHSAAAALGQKNDAIGALFSSLTYPIVVLVMGIGVLIYMKNSVFNQYASIKPIDQWPQIGRNLVTIANFFQDWWWLTLTIMALFTVFIIYVIRNYIGESRQYLDYLPLFRLYRKLTAARFMETLGLLITNGVVFKSGLKILQNQASPYLAWHLMLMDMQLGGGRDNIADVLDTGMIDKSDILRLHVTAEAKGFEHALVRLGRYATIQGNKTVRLTGRILGAVMLAFGAWLASYMVLGIYQVGTSLAN